MMKYQLLANLARVAGKNFHEQDVIDWANQRASSYSGKNWSIQVLNHSDLRDSHMFLHIIESIFPGSVEWTNITTGMYETEALENATYAISLARKFGAKYLFFPT